MFIVFLLKRTSSSSPRGKLNFRCSNKKHLLNIITFSENINFNENSNNYLERALVPFAMYSRLQKLLNRIGSVSFSVSRRSRLSCRGESLTTVNAIWRYFKCRRTRLYHKKLFGVASER